MILIRGGYAFPEVLIASAVFSAGILALAKLSILTEANLLALQRDTGHRQQTQLLALSLGSQPMARRVLLQYISEIDTANVLLSELNNQRQLPPPLYNAEVSQMESNGQVMMHPVITGYTVTGLWQDVVPSASTEQE